ncbi:hypothetical protein T459_01091 [Capsicum annuum]|uniref:F-box domain-containing protein n=1 Tax=Capsicum annuum TaxID=4072 RepID=A0A2G3AG51_CAPAN|nr:hypothetical protein T459_01091 [Capsicum annuum]
MESEFIALDKAGEEAEWLQNFLEDIPYWTKPVAPTMKRDTISNLPCNVLDGILGCLPLKDAVRTSILSKDWRYKWVTRAEIDFSGQFLTSFNNSEEAKIIIHQDPAIFKNLISKCALLESLRLTWCTDFDILEIDAANLKCFDFLRRLKSISFKNAPMLRNVAVWLDSRVLMDPSPICSNLIKFIHYMPSLQEREIGMQALVDPLDDEINSPRENDLCPSSASAYNLTKVSLPSDESIHTLVDHCENQSGPTLVYELPTISEVVDYDQSDRNNLDVLHCLGNPNCDCLVKPTSVVGLETGEYMHKETIVGVHSCDTFLYHLYAHDIFHRDIKGMPNFEDNTLGESESG